MSLTRTEWLEIYSSLTRIQITMVSNVILSDSKKVIVLNETEFIKGKVQQVVGQL